MSNTNSFSENIRQVLKNQANELDRLSAIQKSLTTNDTYVSYSQEDKNGNVETYQMPSVTGVINRLESVEQVVNNLMSGKSTISLIDGTSRQLKLDNVPVAPRPISNQSAKQPTTFNIDSNWFFENFMFPGATVTIDLTGEVDDYADRCRVKRVILDSNNAAAVSAWTNDIFPNSFSYQQLITYLSANGIQYSEDEDIVNFPLVRNGYYGAFQIVKDPITRGGNVWYELDTINYHSLNDNGIENGANNMLAIDDQLLYNNTVYKIIDLDSNKKQVRLQLVSGSEVPGINSLLNYFEYPNKQKELKIRFGAHEFDIIYIKAVQEEYNLLSNVWSVPYMFDSDSLIFERDNKTSFATYYTNNIVDWGSNMIAEAKERNIKAYNGKTPNAPVLYADDFRVVQINTQINAALDNTDIKNTANEIVTTKSNINSLKSTIASQKSQLQTINDYDEYQALFTQINNNINELDSLQISYSSLVKYLQNLVKENSAVIADPKYHVRGFFDIPELQYSDDGFSQPQQIIGFDIAYRYIKEDDTGVALNTYTYTGNNGVDKMEGVFSDWNIFTGKLLDRDFNKLTGVYEWNDENTANSETININQIDIPISKGERVEFKVRAISEAGYPSNCLKSAWSNSIIMEFPSNLSTTSELASLIEDTNDENVTLAIDNILRSSGLTSHISDSITNTNSVSGVYYKHIANNIGFERKNSLNNTIETVSVQDIIDGLLSNYNSLYEKYNNIINLYDDMVNKYKAVTHFLNTSLPIINATIREHDSILVKNNLAR